MKYRSHWLLPGVFTMLLACMLVTYGCKVNYSFTGASISPDVRTISIPVISNNAPLVVPTLSHTLTDAVRDYFTSQTNLVMVDRNGDLSVEGTITGYDIQPVAIQGNEKAAMNRLTITISVKFTNRKDQKQNFENSFSRYEDYLSTQSLASVQDGLIKDITDQLVQDIFNKSVANW
ncbi:MAG: LptE family protein [Bacteroidota bacterium]|nr:LptE family protein [Bacteroidota bacterium]